jgi:invasion protein IalB
MACASGETVFKDWRITCTQEDAVKTCQMLQSQPATVGGADVFLISLSQSEGSKDISAVVSVPLGVYLAPGIEIHIAGRRPFKTLYEICDQTSCHAGFKLKGSVLSSFKRGSEAKFRVWTAKSKAVEFPVSLSGFTAGYTELTSMGAN